MAPIQAGVVEFGLAITFLIDLQSEYSSAPRDISYYPFAVMGPVPPGKSPAEEGSGVGPSHSMATRAIFRDASWETYTRFQTNLAPRLGASGCAGGTLARRLS